MPGRPRKRTTLTDKSTTTSSNEKRSKKKENQTKSSEKNRKNEKNLKNKNTLSIFQSNSQSNSQNQKLNITKKDISTTLHDPTGIESFLNDANHNNIDKKNFKNIKNVNSLSEKSRNKNINNINNQNDSDINNIKTNSDINNIKTNSDINNINHTNIINNNSNNININNQSNNSHNDTSYHVIKKVGAGTYGTVYLAHRDHATFALKQVRRIGKKTGLPNSFIRELKALATLATQRHRNVVTFYECYTTSSDQSGNGLSNFNHNNENNSNNNSHFNNSSRNINSHNNHFNNSYHNPNNSNNLNLSKIEVFMVFEYMELDLHAYMLSRFALDEPTIIDISYQILEGLRYIHGNGIVHRDLKPSNILINYSGDSKNKNNQNNNNKNKNNKNNKNDKSGLVVKIADFGMSRTVAKSEIDETCIEYMSSSSEEGEFDVKDFEEKDFENNLKDNLNNNSNNNLKDNLRDKDEENTSKDDNKSSINSLNPNNTHNPNNNNPNNNPNKKSNWLEKVKRSTLLMTPGICTLWYRSPELLFFMSYTQKSDIWSVGVIILELCCMENVLAGENEPDQIRLIHQIDLIIHNIWQKGQYSNALKTLVSHLLKIQQSERTTAQQALLLEVFLKS